MLFKKRGNMKGHDMCWEWNWPHFYLTPWSSLTIFDIDLRTQTSGDHSPGIWFCLTILNCVLIDCGYYNSYHEEEVIEYNLILPKYGNLMTVEEWRGGVECGGFIDYDGFGHPVKNNKMADVPCYPSEADLVPSDATHIMWFNR